MNLRPAILSAPFPWLIMLTAKLFGKEAGQNPNKKKHKGVFRLPRTLSFTYEGKRYVAILILIGFAAINTGNNLLYLIVAMLLSIIIISGIMSESTLRKVIIKRQPQGSIFKGEPVKIIYEVTNIKKKIPSYSLTLKESEAEDPGGVEGTGTYIVKIDNLSNKTLRAEYRFLRRGLHQLEGVSLSTRFPFGLFTKTKTIDIPMEVLVYPAITPREVEGNYNGSFLGQTVSNKKGFGGDLFGARQHRPEDDSRHIDWKSSAKSGTLMQREFTKDSEREVIINFKNYGGDNDLNEKFETSVDEAASLAEHFFSLGFSVGLTTLGSTIKPNISENNRDKILKELALIKPFPSSSGGSQAVVTVESN